MASGETYWCYTCRQPIQVVERDAICPYCNQGLLQQSNELLSATESRNAPRDVVGNFISRLQRGIYLDFGHGCTLFVRLPRHLCTSTSNATSMSDLIEQHNRNRVSQSCIDAIPIIKITQSDSQCPICLEEFEVGHEAKKMPCDHI
ncbi:E3 ubiquitin-protein ligase RZF1-like, partial [Cajanus cajan]|uniref:E3 ubiquitin-protein ligase RZF1-like n=1 Tax=Cajanus cajan TaxID=3821 RepID=UPI00098DC26A